MNQRAVGDYIYSEPKIGTGSFAEVFKGFHKTTGQLVAIKIVDLERLSRNNPKLKRHLESEIRIMQSLDHPNIVRLFDVILPSESYIVLILEYCSGGDFSKYIRRHKRLSEPQTQIFMQQLASGLKFLRMKKIIHRDLKPQNLLLTSEVNPILKIGDFGFARFIESQSLADTLCGSPLYMAPEILKFHNYSIKADLWSVGTILYETLTGVTPFDSKTPFELMQALEKKQVRFPDTIPISRECLDLIYSLLQKDPAKRISWEEFFMHPWLNTERDLLSNAASSFPLAQSPNYQSYQQTSPYQHTPQTTPQHIQSSPYQNYQQSSPYQIIPNLSQTPTPSIPIQSPTFHNYQQTSPYQNIPNLSQTPPHQNFSNVNYPFQSNPLNIPQQTYTPSPYQNPSSSPLSSPPYHFKGSPLDTPFSNTIGSRPETLPLPFSEVPPFSIPSSSPNTNNNTLPINLGPFYPSTPPFSTPNFPNANPSSMLQSSLSGSNHGGGSVQMSSTFSHKQVGQQSVSGSNYSTPTGSLSLPQPSTTTNDGTIMNTAQSRTSTTEYTVPTMLSDSFEIIDTPQTSHSVTEPYTALPTNNTSSYTPSLPVTTPRPSFENNNNSNSNINTSVTMEDPIITLTQNIERMGRQSLVLAELADGRVETDVPHEALPAYLRALNLLQKAILDGLKTLKGRGVGLQSGSLGIEFSDSQKFVGLVKVIGMLRERFSEYLKKAEYWKSVLPSNLTTPVLEEMIYTHALDLGRIAGVDEMWLRFQKSEQLYNNGVILLEYLYQLANFPEDKRILGEYIQSFNKRLQAVRKKSLQTQTTPGKK